LRVRFSKRALAQMDGIFAYIAKDNPVAADSVVERIHSVSLLLGEYPYIGHTTVRESIRILAVTPYPYLLFYSVIPSRSEVRILSVRHGARSR
jgi:toxin ParE1/3/4